MKKRLLFILPLAIYTVMAWAQTTVDRIEYTLNDNGTATIVVQAATLNGSIHIPATIDVNGSVYKVTDANTRAFSSCKALNKVKCDVPTNLATVSQGMFNGCSALTELQLPEGVKETKAYFIQGAGVKKLTLPNSLISMSRLGDAKSLEEIIIGTGLSTISAEVFAKSTALTTVTLMNPIPPSVHATTFIAGNLPQMTLYVPDESLEAYKAHTTWSKFGTIETISQKIAKSQLTLSTDSLYRITNQGLALSDLGGADGQATMETESFFSYSQLWTLQYNAESSAYMFRNLGTERYIQKTDEGYVMSDTPSEASAHFVFYLEPIVGLNTAYVFPMSNAQGSTVGIFTDPDEQSGWDVERCYHKDKEKLPGNSDTPTSLPDKPLISTERPFTIQGQLISFESPCHVYNIMGQCLAHNISTELTLSIGIYIVQDASGKGSWKIMITN